MHRMVSKNVKEICPLPQTYGSAIMTTFSMISLRTRVGYYLRFVFKILSGKIDCAETLFCQTQTMSLNISLF